MNTAERARNVLRSDVFHKRFQENWSWFIAFSKYVTQEHSERYTPIGVENLSPLQEEMLVYSMALVINPRTLEKSNCTHRTVSSVIALHYPNGLTRYQKRGITTMLGTQSVFNIVVESEDQGDFLLVHGDNNWGMVEGEIPPEHILDCKLTPGHPINVPRDHLVHLPEDKPMGSNEHIDNACPKRLYGADCYIAHAENTVIKQVGDLYKIFNLAPSSRTIMTNTWTPCFNCFSNIVKNRHMYGSEIDFVSVYRAMGDEEDEKSVRRMKAYLHDSELGEYSGPYISVAKEPGYGWLPAKHDIASDIIRELLMEKTVDKRGFLLYEAAALVAQFQKAKPSLKQEDIVHVHRRHTE